MRGNVLATAIALLVGCTPGSFASQSVGRAGVGNGSFTTIEVDLTTHLQGASPAGTAAAGYAPLVTTLAVGNFIRFANSDGFAHTATAIPGNPSTFPSAYPFTSAALISSGATLSSGFSSRNLQAGATSATLLADKPGSYVFGCFYHYGAPMRGVIVVHSCARQTGGRGARWWRPSPLFPARSSRSVLRRRCRSSQRYQLQCGVCHTVLPELTAFGNASRDHGFRLPAAADVYGNTGVALRYNQEYEANPVPGTRRFTPTASLLSEQNVGAIGAYVHYNLGAGGAPGAPYLGYLVTHNEHTQALYRVGLYELPLTQSPGQRLDDIGEYGYFGTTVGQNDLALNAPARL